VFLLAPELMAARQIGKVAYLSGNATMSVKSLHGGTWQALKAGDPLYQGSRIKTKKNTRFEGRLNDGSMIRLGASSDIKLQTASFNKKKKKKVFRARLFVGSMWASVTKLFGSASRFEVATDNAVAGVRGTRFSATRAANGTTTVKVYSGKVLVSNKPAYAVKGATKKNRVQVAGPQEISKKEWEEMVTTAMQIVQVAQGGAMEKPTAFALTEADEWEAWNNERDKLAGIHR